MTDWMQAWGSLAGVFAGLAAAGAAAALLLHERKRASAAESQLAEERAEAKLAVPRSMVVTSAHFGSVGPAEAMHVYGFDLHLHNFGGLPIRNVALIVALPADLGYLLLPRLTVIGPAGVERISRRLRQGPRLPEAPIPMICHVTACYLDHSGQAWQVTSDGGISATTVSYPAAEEAAARPDTIRLDIT